MKKLNNFWWMYELQKRGERFISVDPETGVIITMHGKSTRNHWIIKNDELLCIQCFTIYSHSI